MNKFFLSAMAGLMLSACASMGGMSNLQKIEVGCTSAAAAMKTIVEVNEVKPLPAGVAADVRKAVQVISPVCLSETPPTLDLVEMAIFEAAVDILEGVAK